MPTQQRIAGPDLTEAAGHAVDCVLRQETSVLVLARTPVRDHAEGWPGRGYLVADAGYRPRPGTAAEAVERHDWVLRHADIRLRRAEPGWTVDDADRWLDEQQAMTAATAERLPAVLTAVVFTGSALMRISTGARVEAALENDDPRTATLLPAAVLHTVVAARGDLDAVPAELSFRRAGTTEAGRAALIPHRPPIPAPRRG